MTPTNKLRWFRRKANGVETTERYPPVLQQWWAPDWQSRATGEPEEHGWRDVPIEDEK